MCYALLNVCSYAWGVTRVLTRKAVFQIIVEPLLHSHGPANNTAEHRWMVHDLPPGKDYFNWTARCVSAGQVFDPYHVSTGFAMAGTIDNKRTDH